MFFVFQGSPPVTRPQQQAQPADDVKKTRDMLKAYRKELADQKKADGGEIKSKWVAKAKDAIRYVDKLLAKTENAFTGTPSQNLAKYKDAVKDALRLYDYIEGEFQSNTGPYTLPQISQKRRRAAEQFVIKTGDTSAAYSSSGKDLFTSPTIPGLPFQVRQGLLEGQDSDIDDNFNPYGLTDIMGNFDPNDQKSVAIYKELLEVSAGVLKPGDPRRKELADYLVSNKEHILSTAVELFVDKSGQGLTQPKLFDKFIDIVLNGTKQDLVDILNEYTVLFQGIQNLQEHGTIELRSKKLMMLSRAVAYYSLYTADEKVFKEVNDNITKADKKTAFYLLDFSLGGGVTWLDYMVTGTDMKFNKSMETGLQVEETKIEPFRQNIVQGELGAGMQWGLLLGALDMPGFIIEAKGFMKVLYDEFPELKTGGNPDWNKVMQNDNVNNYLLNYQGSVNLYNIANLKSGDVVVHLCADMLDKQKPLYTVTGVKQVQLVKSNKTALQVQLSYQNQPGQRQGAYASLFFIYRPSDTFQVMFGPGGIGMQGASFSQLDFTPVLSPYLSFRWGGKVDDYSGKMGPNYQIDISTNIPGKQGSIPDAARMSPSIQLTFKFSGVPWSR